MQETILSRLEASRKELLDLGLRNSLLNYRTSKARGVEIVQEKSAYIYDILVKQGKAMSFLAKPGKDDEDEETDLPELTEPELEEGYSDTKLQTNETEQKLQRRLLNTYYFARTSIEEQGVNILYLSLGMLNWYEQGNTEQARLAPLVLIPVTLARSSAHERFRLCFTGSEIGTNLSLQAKMLADFNITIPDLPEADDIDIIQYMHDIEKRIMHQSQWKIDFDAIHLGFFSFGKFMIYHDLDSDEWPEENKPHNHPLLQAIYHDGFNDSPPTATEEHDIDRETKAHELFQVVDADSSQLLSMLAVHEGRNMVIQGPPGTGKSQTITNIIANAIGHGKKVLFVAEKMAALEVVKRRLDYINLGEACLELHSHKSNKKELHEELQRILALGRPKLTDLQQEIILLDEYRAELNDYCRAINASIGQSGLSAQQVIGFLLQIKESSRGIELPSIPIEDIAAWDAKKMNRAEAAADRIQAFLQDNGVPANLLFWGTKLTVLLPHQEEAVKKTLQGAKEATEAIKQAIENAATQLGEALPVNRAETIRLASLAQIASESPDLKELDLKHEAWLNNRDDLVEFLDCGKRLSALHEQYRDIFLPEAWEQEVLDIRKNLLAYGDKWYRFIISAYSKAKKQLAALCKTSLPKAADAKLKYVDDILEAKRLEASLKEHEHFIPLFGNRWQKLRTNWPDLIEAAAYLHTVHQQVSAGTCSAVIFDYLAKHEKPEIAAEHARLLREQQEAQEKALQAALVKIDLDEEVRFGEIQLAIQPYQNQLTLLSQWIERFPEIYQVIKWNTLADTIRKENFLALIRASTHWEHAADLLKTALRNTWYEYLIEKTVTEQAALRKFDRASHEEVIEKFRKLDLLNQQYNRARAALTHFEGLPRYEAGGQVSILRNEFNRKARHKPIRRLVEEAGIAIQAIKPVWMMSPLSIANFIPPGSVEFDLVIFDEASQVRPVEALGALLRGRQVVVVGDTKQLPPTSFFDKMNTDTEDEGNVTADMQSILGMCDAQGAPQSMLRWHYRSRHESLISLSNQEFYENKLVIFPSPGSRYRMGLVYHYLEEAVYDRGNTRTNPKEAEAVADAVISHAFKDPKHSLGVVAFSAPQMQAIQDALEIRRRKQPEVESFFSSHTYEPFFVKNLENVQGDERDVIFISIGYGRIEDGKVPTNFGPLNKDGGERRLNVLITRSKLRCEVFANIAAEDIKITPTTKFGIRSLKNFLYYAQHGKFDAEQDIPIPRKRPFENLVATQLDKLGYLVREQVGTEGCYLDLAVVDTENPGRYILGIECDGETYSAARSAGERDRLRKQVLETFGWNIYRLWSTDWYRNPGRELELLVAVIEKAKEQTALLDAATEELEQSINGMEREQKEDPSAEFPLYEFAILPAEVARQELHLHPSGKLGEWLEEIVKVESPIHMDEAFRRMAEAAGVTKVGSRIRHALLRATGYAQQTGRIRIKEGFLWHPEMQTPVIRVRSHLPSSSRKLQYIAPEEIHQAIKKVVEDAIAIQPEDTVPLVAKLFGYSRVTEDMKQTLLNAIQSSITKQIMQNDGEFLRVKEHAKQL